MDPAAAGWLVRAAEADALAGVWGDRLRAELAAARELAALATEYRVDGPGGGVRIIRRYDGAGWSVREAAWPSLERRTLLPSGWSSADALSLDELFCWPDAVTAVTAARRALGGEPRG